MFTSTSLVIFMPCGHCIHQKCHQEHTQTSYQCPTCLKSLADMTEYYKRIDDSLLHEQGMPSEYDKTYANIFCNDCEVKSYAKFHFLVNACLFIVSQMWQSKMSGVQYESSCNDNGPS